MGHGAIKNVEPRRGSTEKRTEDELLSSVLFG
jgi:hypothetical protein